MNNSKSKTAGKAVVAATAIAGALAAVVALSDEKNRKKVTKLATQLKLKAEDVIDHLKQLADQATSKKGE